MKRRTARQLRALQKTMIQPIRDRDGCKDILTGKTANDVHEICPAWMFKKGYKHLAFQRKNMCCVSRATHREAACQRSRWQMLTKLQELYSYDYTDEPWAAVLRRGEDG